jgi:polyisoprenoid-binding protein YceI
MPTTQWTVDPLHSEVAFKVKHLMIATVTGTFGAYSASMLSDAADFSDAQITFSADIASINTGNAQRDGHLKGDDFFNAETFPTMSFTSTSIAPTGKNEYKLVGDMTIRDVTKSIELTVEHGGTMVDFYGNTKAGFDITGKLNRKDFNLNWSAVTEAGGIVVSDEVRLALSIQMQKVTA